MKNVRIKELSDYEKVASTIAAQIYISSMEMAMAALKDKDEGVSIDELIVNSTMEALQIVDGVLECTRPKLR